MPSLLLPLLVLLSPAADLIQVEALSSADESLHVVARTKAAVAACPQCGTVSGRVHSRYTRTLADLPCCGIPVVLTLQARRFFCDARECPQRTFAERLSEAAPPYARRTTRLHAALVPLAFAVGGRPGAALARTLRMGVSHATMLRLIRHTPCTDGAEPPPRVVGVDDWAWKRGARYGTLLCDLERRRPLDLLAERETASTAAWLASHPGIAVVSRDRGGIYADAAAQGATGAVQVADRWHLLKNLGDAVEQFLRRERIRLPSANQDDPVLAAVATTTVHGATALASPVEQADAVAEETPARSGRQERFAHVHARRQAGASIRAIAQECGMARNTVRRYLRATHVPDWQRATRRTRLDPYRAFVLARWNAGCQNASQLFRELRDQGYRGGATQVAVFVARLRHRLPAQASVTSAPRPPSPRDLRWLLARRPDDLDEEEHRQLHTLGAAYPAVATAHTLVQRFAGMVRARQADALEDWLTEAASVGIPELEGFAFGVRRDRAAVEAGLTLPWSQGQVEGQITRLKLLKRSMYGRANFDLLRQRVLYRPAVA